MSSKIYSQWTRNGATALDRCRLRKASSDALEEAIRSREFWPAHHSAHECYGVLSEEVAELLDEIRRKESDPERIPNIRKELMQVAAVAIRGMVEIGD